MLTRRATVRPHFRYRHSRPIAAVTALTFYIGHIILTANFKFVLRYGMFVNRPIKMFIYKVLPAIDY